MSTPPDYILFSPAKINLSLSVGPLRSDGYHSVDSFFHLIALADFLEIRPAKSFCFSSSVDLNISTDDNLIVRAIDQMVQVHPDKSGNSRPPIHVHLKKNIPHGAGLGGGSSNAAAIIYYLSLQWGLRPDDPRHLDFAARLGSDVPLFLAPTTASLMTGRGEILKESLPAISNMHLVIALPTDAHSPTAAVYQAFDRNPQPTHSLDKWQNNLEKAAIQVSPQTGQVLDWLRAQQQTLNAQVAGSGCACWAHSATKLDADILAHAARQQGFRAIVTHTTARGIHRITGYNRVHEQ